MYQYTETILINFNGLESVHRILPFLDSLMVSTGQIICIYLLCEQWTAGNHRCHNSVVNRALKVALVSLRCKCYQWMEDIYRVTIIENEASVRLFSNDCRLSVAFVSVSSLTGLQWCSPISLLSVINGSRVLSPLLGSVWAGLHSEMEKHQSSSRRWCQSRYCFNKPPWVSVTCLWTCSGAHTAVSQRLHVLSTTPFCSLTTLLVLMSALIHKPTTINNRADHIQWEYNQHWVWLKAKIK